MAAIQFHSNRNQQWLLLALLGVLAWLLATRPLEQIILASVLIAGAVLLLRWPWLAWPGLAAALPFAGALEVGPLSATDLLLAAAIALWFADGVRRLELAIHWYTPPVLTLVYIGALFLSTLGAADLGEAIKEVVKWSEFALVLLLVPSAIRPVQIQWLVAALLVGGIGQAGLGLYQFFNGIGPEWFFILGGYMRASGSFLQPNPYAGYLGLCLPAAVSLALWSIGNLHRDPRRLGDGQRNRALWWDWIATPSLVGKITLAAFYIGASAMIAAGLLASWSRGGWLGALAGVGAVLVFRSRRTVLLTAVLMLVIFIALLLGMLSPLSLPAPVVDRLQDLSAYIGMGDVLSQPVTDENFSVIERLAHWVAAVRMWEMAPWLGVGPGSYETIYPLVRLPQWEEALGHAHNVYLNVLGETGIIGFVAYAALWIGVIAWSIKRLRRSQAGSWQAALALGVLGVLLHLTVHNLFDNLFVQGMYLHVGLWLASLKAMSPEKHLEHCTSTYTV